jgi:DNA polymerase III subunit delta'
MSLFDDEEDDVAAAADAAAPAADLSPRQNPDLFGHEAAEAAILSDYNARRLPHALILAGEPGIGKATFAFRIARFLLSREEGGLFGDAAPETSLRLAPEHPVFRRTVSGGHADLLLIERAWDEKKEKFKNDISAEDARSIAPFLRKTAGEGGWRIVIVDGAECLNTASQNALLKILEEPPSKALLILTTSQPGLLLPTIRSRCRMMRLEPLPDAALGALLDQRGVPQGERAALLRLAQGSAGKALRYRAGEGLAVAKEVEALAATLPRLDTALAHDLAEKLGRAEDAFEAAREILTNWCLSAAQSAARGKPPAHTIAIPRAFETWEKMSGLFRDTENYNLDRKLCLLNAFLLLQNPDHQVPTP